MRKDPYYFQHDYNPTNDPRIVCLIGNHGGLGYGVYWRIIELLHQEKENKLPIKIYIYEAIAKQMLTSAEQIENIINDCFKYELFQKNNEFFWSNRVLLNMKKREEISEKRSEAGKAGAIAKQKLANTSKEKKIKEKESKENKIINLFIKKYMSLAEEVIKTGKYLPYYEKSKQKAIHIIGWYYDYYGSKFENTEQLQSSIPRNIKAAKLLTGYSKEKIYDCFKYLDDMKIKGKNIDWTLNAVARNIDSV